MQHAHLSPPGDELPSIFTSSSAFGTPVSGHGSEVVVRSDGTQFECSIQVSHRRWRRPGRFEGPRRAWRRNSHRKPKHHAARRETRRKAWVCRSPRRNPPRVLTRKKKENSEPARPAMRHAGLAQGRVRQGIRHCRPQTSAACKVARPAAQTTGCRQFNLVPFREPANPSARPRAPTAPPITFEAEVGLQCYPPHCTRVLGAGTYRRGRPRNRWPADPSGPRPGSSNTVERDNSPKPRGATSSMRPSTITAATSLPA